MLAILRNVWNQTPTQFFLVVFDITKIKQWIKTLLGENSGFAWPKLNISLKWLKDENIHYFSLLTPLEKRNFLVTIHVLQLVRLD